MGKWPKDNQDARNAFYGVPGAAVVAQRVDIRPPFPMYYDGKPITTIRFHKKAADALMAALLEIRDAYGRNQAAIDKAGISAYGGSYNMRKVRGSDTKWSNHAYGAALDLSPIRNPMGGTGDMPQAVIDAFCRQGAMWGGWYNGRKDPMHFEFVDNGGRKPTLPPPGSATAAPRVVAQANPAAMLVERIQSDLIAMGYVEVGEVDGKWGTKTDGAVAMFLRDAGLTSYTTPDTLAMFITQRKLAGMKRGVPPERAYATPQTVAAKVPAVASNRWTKFWSKLMAIPATIYGVASNVPAANDAISPALNTVKQYVPNISVTLIIISIAVVGFIMWYTSRKAEQAAVADYQTGRTS